MLKPNPYEASEMTLNWERSRDSGGNSSVLYSFLRPGFSGGSKLGHSRTEDLESQIGPSAAAEIEQAKGYCGRITLPTACNLIQSHLHDK